MGKPIHITLDEAGTPCRASKKLGDKLGLKKKGNLL